MSWFYLFLAGLSEVGWAIAMKYANGFTKLVPSLLTIVLMLLSFLLLAQALKSLPLSTAYAIWTGIGTVGTFLFGFVMLHESISWLQALCVGLILLGVCGLKLLN